MAVHDIILCATFPHPYAGITAIAIAITDIPTVRIHSMFNLDRSTSVFSLMLVELALRALLQLHDNPAYRF